MSRLSYSRWECQVKHSVKDIHKIRNFVVNSDLELGEKRVMLRLLGYILEKRLPRKLREIDDSDLYLRMLLLTPSIPTELDYIEPLWDGTKIIDLNKRKEEQDEHTTVQSA